MTSKNLEIIKTIALVIGAGVAAWPIVGALNGEGSSNIDDLATLLFPLWLVSPYLALLVITWPVERFTKIPGLRVSIMACRMVAGESAEILE